MSEPTAPVNATDPLRILGLSRVATEEEVRSRYLKLVKQFPPERDPERFREIHAAFQAARDPLVLARHLLTAPEDSPPTWSEVIERQKASPPDFSVDLLLSLGNRDNNFIDEPHGEHNE